MMAIQTLVRVQIADGQAAVLELARQSNLPSQRPYRLFVIPELPRVEAIYLFVSIWLLRELQPMLSSTSVFQHIYYMSVVISDYIIDKISIFQKPPLTLLQRQHQP